MATTRGLTYAKWLRSLAKALENIAKSETERAEILGFDGSLEKGADALRFIAESHERKLQQVEREMSNG